MEALLKSISAMGSVVICLILFASSFLENWIPVIPGDVMIVFGAYLAGGGAVYTPGLVSSVILGSFLGCATVYYLGRTKGRSLFSRRRLFILSERNVKRTERWIERYGDKVILINRFLPGVRFVIAPLAGMGGMAPRRFLTFAFLGILLWNGLLIAAGMIAGANWGYAIALLKGYNWIALIGMVCAGVFLVCWIRGRSLKVEQRARTGSDE